VSAAWDRFQASLAGQDSCQMAAGPLVAADHATQLAGLPLSQVVKSSELLAQVLGSAHELYRGDFLIVFSDVAVEAEAMGCHLEFPENAPPHVVQSVEPEKLAETDPMTDGRLPMMVAATAALMEKYGGEVPVFASLKDPFSAAALACGTEEFLALLIAEPAKVQFALQVALKNQQRYLEALLETGAHLIIGAPLASGGILGGRHFRDFAYDPIRDLVIQAKSKGRLTGIHSCGDANSIIDLLAELPVDFLSLETFDVQHWKNLAGRQKTPAIMGWFPTGMLLSSKPQEIEQEIKVEAAALQGYAHILATACDVPQMASAQHVQSFMYAARTIKRVKA
jgi:uroporphyrinogen decarboxylase